MFILRPTYSDLDTNVDLSGMTFIDDTAFVIWKWSWKKEFSFDGDDALKQRRRRTRLW